MIVDMIVEKTEFVTQTGARMEQINLTDDGRILSFEPATAGKTAGMNRGSSILRSGTPDCTHAFEGLKKLQKELKEMSERGDTIRLELALDSTVALLEGACWNLEAAIERTELYLKSPVELRRLSLIHI